MNIRPDLVRGLPLVVATALAVVVTGCGASSSERGIRDVDAGSLDDAAVSQDVHGDGAVQDAADPRDVAHMEDASDASSSDAADVDSGDTDVATRFNPRFRRVGRLLSPHPSGAVSQNEYRLALSADASCVVFTTASHAALDPLGIDVETHGVYLVDLATEVFERVDLESDGSIPVGEEEARFEYGSEINVDGRGEGGRRVVSGDCQVVAFTSSLDLGPSADEGGRWTYIRDRASSSTLRASFPEGHDGPSVVSADGNRVFFRDHLESRDGGPPWVQTVELWMWDRALQTRTWVRPADATVRATPSTEIHASSDGAVVSFFMVARPNVPTLCPSGQCLARVEPDTGVAEIVFEDLDRGNGAARFAMSHDGARYAVYTGADLLDLVAEDVTPSPGLYWLDLPSGELRLINRGGDGLPLSGVGTFFDINADGRYVVFAHASGEPLIEGGPAADGLYRYDADADALELLNVDADGVYNPNVRRPRFDGLAIDGSGQVIVFRDHEAPGFSNGLVPGDPDELDTGLFIWDGR